MHRTIPPQADCPCGSGQTYKQCCRPFHNGKHPSHPEQLMRARYTAYAIDNIDFIMSTTHPDSPHYESDKAAWRKSLRAFSDGTQFIGLKVMESHMSDDQQVGYVRFQAILIQGGRNASFIEHSRFEKVKNRWMYVKGETPTPHT